MPRAVVWLGLLLPAVAAAQPEGVARRTAEHLAALEKSLDGVRTDGAESLRRALAEARKGEPTEAPKALADSVFLKAVINPEGRVKLARGPAEFSPVAGEPFLALLEVENQSGAQQELTLETGFLGKSDNPLSARFLDRRGHPGALQGLPKEYRIVRIEGGRPGKYEITFRIQAGPGTQELGFRGEIPVLFTFGKPR